MCFFYLRFLSLHLVLAHSNVATSILSSDNQVSSNGDIFGEEPDVLNDGAYLNVDLSLPETWSGSDAPEVGFNDDIWWEESDVLKDEAYPSVDLFLPDSWSVSDSPEVSSNDNISWKEPDALVANEPDPDPNTFVSEQSDLSNEDLFHTASNPLNDVNADFNPSATLYSSCKTENIPSDGPLQARNGDACAAEPWKVPSVMIAPLETLEGAGQNPTNLNPLMLNPTELERIFRDPNIYPPELEPPNEEPTLQAPPLLENENELEVENGGNTNNEEDEEEQCPPGYPIRMCCKGFLQYRSKTTYRVHQCVKGTSFRMSSEYGCASSKLGQSLLKGWNRPLTLINTY
jgi:hypothetical protein